MTSRWTPPERRVPPLLWVRIRSDLSQYLVERGIDGVIVYAWYDELINYYSDFFSVLLASL